LLGALLLGWLGGAPAAPGGESYRGQLLVASESMGDPRFRDSVIYMVQHDADGAMGLVVNHPLGELPLEQIISRQTSPSEEGENGADAPESPAVDAKLTLYYGGPVASNHGFILHSAEVLLADSLAVDETFAMTTSAELLHLVERGEGPRRLIFAVGYAGWAPGQLESEIARDSWFVIPAEEALVFAEDPDKTWERARARRGVDL
jgi:putative transcriptional regulator